MCTPHLVGCACAADTRSTATLGAPGVPPHLAELGIRLTLDTEMPVLSFLSAKERTQARAVWTKWRKRLDEQRNALSTERLVERYGGVCQAFSAAIERGDAKDVGLLLHKISWMGQVPLWNLCKFINHAAENGHLAVVERLLQVPDLAQDTVIIGNQGVLHYMQYAFCLAAENGHLPVAERLLGVDGVRASGRNDHAIIGAVGKGQLASVEWLLQFPDVNAAASRNLPIKIAASNGHLAIMERLLCAHGVDATATNNYAIRWAALNGHLAVVERLLQADGVNAAADNNDAIFSAAREGHLGVVERLLQVPAVCSTLNWFDRLLISIMTFRLPHCGARN